FSSIRPDVTQQLAEQARALGFRLLDAPVSGGEAGAKNAALSIMVGGSADDFAEAQPLFEVVGKTVVHVGPSGSGQTVKAANQLIVAANIQAVSEAVVFLEAYGVDTKAALEVLGGGRAGSTVLILGKEGGTRAFGLPGGAINPFYSAIRAHGGIKHVLARNVEAASHMAEGYTRAKAGNIGVCIGTSGPAGTDMITGLYSAQADSIPILCITGQAPRARLYKEDFQAVDIESISKPVTKWSV